jgi:hypothetical protein
LIDPPVSQDSWSADTQSDLLNIAEFKEKSACVKHWKECKMELKRYVAQVKNDAVAKKFELQVKAIGR